MKRRERDSNRDREKEKQRDRKEKKTKTLRLNRYFSKSQCVRFICVLIPTVRYVCDI